MAIQINVGKARIFPLTANMSDGGTNTTIASSVSTFATATLRVLINPSNNREMGVLALASGAAADVTATIGTKNSSVLVQPVTPTLVSVVIGTDAGEVDPPAWLLP